MAAALTYEALPGEIRDAWLDAVESDAPTLSVPHVALYAPLLALETNDGRRSRIEAALERDSDDATAYALHGIAGDGTHVCAIIAPLDGETVQFEFYRFSTKHGILSIRHYPPRHVRDVPASGSAELYGAIVARTPLRVVVEELARAIVGNRGGGAAPAMVCSS